MLLWGDSHANALAKGLRYKLGEKLNETTSSACLPLVDTHFPHRKHCQTTNDFVIEHIQQANYDTIVLHGNWISHPDKIDAFSETLAALQTVNARIIVVGGVPHYLPDLPSFLLTKRLLLDADSAPVKVEPTLFAEIEAIDTKLMAASEQFDNVTFVSALASFCASREQCQVILPSATEAGQWVPAAWDYGHVTLEGALLLSDQIPTNTN